MICPIRVTGTDSYSTQHTSKTAALNDDVSDQNDSGHVGRSRESDKGSRCTLKFTQTSKNSPLGTSKTYRSPHVIDAPSAPILRQLHSLLGLEAPQLPHNLIPQEYPNLPRYSSHHLVFP